MDIQEILFCTALVAGIAYIVYRCNKRTDKLYMVPRVEKFTVAAPKEKFYVYNYYKVPIDVLISKNTIASNETGKFNTGTQMSEFRSEFVGSTDDFVHRRNGTIVDLNIIAKKERGAEIPYEMLVENVLPGKYKAIPGDLWKNITDNKKIRIVEHAKSSPIGESTMTIPEGKTIKALHCGMNSGHTDIAMTGDITKSPLGTALPRLRIVNVTPRTVNLTTTGGNKLTIPPAKSLLYFGEYENGIPMGVTFKDIDGILPDYTLKIPLTDLFLGVISDIEMPLYRGSKIGGAFFDDPGVMYHPFEELNFYQLHRGAFIDKSYIPKDW